MLVLGIYGSLSEIGATLIGEAQGSKYSLMATYRGGPSFQEMNAALSKWRQMNKGPIFTLAGMGWKDSDANQNRFEIATTDILSLEISKMLPLKIHRLFEGGRVVDGDTVESRFDVGDDFIMQEKDIHLALGRLARAIGSGNLRGNCTRAISTDIQSIDLSDAGKIKTANAATVAAAIALHTLMNYRGVDAVHPEIDW
jgi:hypothetical protein